MKLYHLRKLRIIVSLIIFVSILILFLDISNTFTDSISKAFLRLQFFPSLLRFFALFFAFSGLGFLFVILLTLVFGRVYCSSLCPLGTLQDIVINFSKRFKSRKNRKFNYSRFSNKFLRYGILAATLLFWIFGSLFLINLLDPYSNFGKISVTFFQPLFFAINNGLNSLLEKAYIYTLNPLEIKSVPLYVVLVSLSIFMTIIIMSVWRGRLFCNTICPVGSALGIFSNVSLYKIGFQEEACTKCMKCEIVCKAECLDSKNNTVDQSRCVSCFNCFASCPNNGIYYENRYKSVKAKDESVDNKQANDRRDFIKTLATATLAIPMLSGKRLLAQNATGPGRIPTGTAHPVLPPGALNYNHFTSKCIACYLCVSVCPTNVIVPSFFDYGLEGFMQPKLDFHRNFCNFDCVRCGEVCPTGAITQLTHEKKTITQIGVAKFMYESCIVTVDRTDCGACSEHCPTKAVQMVPYNGLFIPEVTPELCIGCGACEYACPTEPYKAIFVESNRKHKEAIPIEESEGPQEHDEDEFPF